MLMFHKANARLIERQSITKSLTWLVNLLRSFLNYIQLLDISHLQNV